jgi:DNA primase large subunit
MSSFSESINDLQFAARYPCTNAAKSIISGKAVIITFDVMERAEKRVADAIEKENIPLLYSDNPELLEIELLSYPVAKMIISLMDRRFLNKYINAEVRRTLNYLRESEQDWQRFTKDFGIILGRSGIDVKAVDIRSYLRYIPKDPECTLVNQNVENGLVIVDTPKFLLLLNEVAKTAISSGMPIPPSSIPKELKKDLDEIVSRLEERFRWKIEVKPFQPTAASGEIAPCMKAIMDNLATGQNVPHIGRWVLAVYLMKKGFDIDTIVKIFSGAPNFDEKITRYQLTNITKKSYSVPSCTTLDSYGVCIAKCGIKNPLQYGRSAMFFQRKRRRRLL